MSPRSKNSAVEMSHCMSQNAGGTFWKVSVVQRGNKNYVKMIGVCPPRGLSTPSVGFENKKNKERRKTSEEGETERGGSSRGSQRA